FGTPYSNDMKPAVLVRGTKIVEQLTDQSVMIDRYTDEALAFIRDNKHRPFFLYFAHNMPHVPISAPKRFLGKSAGGLYGDVVEALDWSTGQILDELKKLNLDRDTLVIFTSDNGPWYLRGELGGLATPLRGGKGGTYDGGMRVPCIMRWPGVIPAGRITTQLAANIDFFPTLAHLAGAQLPTDRTIHRKD